LGISGKTTEDTPIGKAVIGKQIVDKVEVVTDKKVVYEIIGWIKQ